MEIIQQLTEDTYIVKVDQKDRNSKTKVQIQHDYVGFKSSGSLRTKSSDVKLFGKNQIFTNQIAVPHYVQISIREMIQVVMPLLNNSPYLKPSHLVAADNSPKYSYYNQIIYYWDTAKQQSMVATCLKGEASFNHMTETFFNQFVKNNI